MLTLIAISRLNAPSKHVRPNIYIRTQSNGTMPVRKHIIHSIQAVKILSEPMHILDIWLQHTFPTTQRDLKSRVWWQCSVWWLSVWRTHSRPTCVAFRALIYPNPPLGLLPLTWSGLWILAIIVFWKSQIFVTTVVNPQFHPIRPSIVTNSFVFGTGRKPAIAILNIIVTTLWTEIRNVVPILMAADLYKNKLSWLHPQAGYWSRVW